MAARATQTDPVPTDPEIPATEPEQFSALSPEPVIIPAAPVIPQESAVFLEEWASTLRLVEPELLGTFLFIARQNRWFADTPSGWQLKFSRWVANGE